MLHIHCEVPKGWACVIRFKNKKGREFRDATRVYTNQTGQIVVIHGHQDVGTKVVRFSRKDVTVVSVREVWQGAV